MDAVWVRFVLCLSVSMLHAIKMQMDLHDSSKNQSIWLCRVRGHIRNDSRRTTSCTYLTKVVVVCPVEETERIPGFFPIRAGVEEMGRVGIRMDLLRVGGSGCLGPHRSNKGRPFHSFSCRWNYSSTSHERHSFHQGFGDQLQYIF